jgi:hypothetical protein
VAQWYVRVNLASAKFPLLTEFSGRTIIVPQYDQNYDRQLVSMTDGDKDKGVPQAFYMHNVTPTFQGYQSVGYAQAIPPQGDGSTTDFDACFVIQTAAQARYLFVPSVGKNYVYSGTTKQWVSTNPIAPGTLRSNVQVTAAYIHGETYIYYANYGCLRYDTPTTAFVTVILASLNPANVKGVCAANGYMLTWTDTAVAWSSLVDPTDFLPSLTTGAGGGSINEAKGKIISCLPISGGFLVYCERNVVSARYTGNTAFPFVFVEVPGSAGISGPETVSWQSNLATHYAWTTAGLQELDRIKTTNSLLEATDFLASRQFEDFDETTNTFTQQTLAKPVNVKLCVIGSRFLIISYGIQSGIYTHALYYDIALMRWGKLKITHTDCFDFAPPSLVGPLTYSQLAGTPYASLSGITYGDLQGTVTVQGTVRSTIAFLQSNGTVQLVDFGISEATASGVIWMGKYQFVRNKLIIHLGTDIETERDNNTFDCFIVPTIDGKTFLTPTKGFLQQKSPKMRSYNNRVTGMNYALYLRGAFALNTIVTWFTTAGTR